MDIIVGGGKYGCYAAEFLKEKGRSFVVVDIDPNCLVASRLGLRASSEVGSRGAYFKLGDLETVLNILENLDVEFMFPTVPTHLAADLAGLKFGLEPWAGGIDSMLPRLPQAVVLQAGKGKLVVSFNRDNSCMDKCAMPDVCPSSGVRKPCKMTDLVSYASPDAFMLLSHSMAPGLGALKGAELAQFFVWAEKKEKFVVATACDCHGVVTAFQKRKSRAKA